MSDDTFTFTIRLSTVAELLRSHVVCQPLPGAAPMADHGHTGCYAGETAARAIDLLDTGLAGLVGRTSKARMLGTHGCIELADELRALIVAAINDGP